MTQCRNSDFFDAPPSIAEPGRHGLAKALVNFEPDLLVILNKERFLTRDLCVVERKK